MFAQFKTLSTQNETSLPCGITEIVLPPLLNPGGLDLVLPMLAHLSQASSNRWFTWIGSEQLSRTKATEYQLRDEVFRFVRSPNDKETLWMFWEALSNGNSATVVAVMHHIDEKNRRLLEQAAQRGGSLGIILRGRTN